MPPAGPLSACERQQLGLYLEALARTPCMASCSGRACGDDTCGGSCGACAADQKCDLAAGACRSAMCTPSSAVRPRPVVHVRRPRGSRRRAASYVLDKLQGTNMCAGSQMPKTEPALTTPQLNTIRAWIGGGALNN